ncbi:DUF294 nucleotidyltransferase-like domain-containing protein [Desulfurispirillum indicum]|uniref:DUF294 nucleotidyltransferase-like domain-containing protein n=1 Tax=Desulfurispirillum indicum TaxID=936456 RepID=UPI001CFA6A79|nr:DUF294 nucleotidyltransferase-like domain-containing protein [Desulfurispirillum indicum]UCZ55907.1 DUF294 nucleotidyltransferase-like domain-containing protein [Desulfurispirillum indicum]
MNQSRKSWQLFFLRIAFPAAIAILLFLFSILFLVIPATENALISERQETTRQLTETAWSVLKDMHMEYERGAVSEASAKEIASNVIRTMRYGEDGKDYFWLLDQQPRMLAHPHRPDLEGQDVSDFEDCQGKRLFAEFAELTRSQHSGFVDYHWQTRDQDGIAPKISYVKLFEPWGWIVGTGIYVDDVRHDIQKMTENTLLISLGITFVIAGIVLFVVVQGITIERARQRAETDLAHSKEKYHALVEASTDGFILLLGNWDMVTNRSLALMLGYTDEELRLLSIFDLFARADVNQHPALEHIKALMAGHKAAEKFEAQLLTRTGAALDALITCSAIEVAGQRALTLIIRDISAISRMENRRAEEERDALVAELQAALQFFHHGIKDFIRPLLSCDMNTSIRRAARLMGQKGTGALMVTSDRDQYLGILTDYDIRERVVARKVDPELPVLSIMTAPIISISDRALVFEAALVMQDEDIPWLAVEDSNGVLCGMINRADLLKIQGYSAVSLVQSIQSAESPEEIRQRREKLPMLIKAVLDSGTRPRNVTRIISNLSDAIIRKLLHFAMAELGDPPTRFAFITLGSVGREEQTLCTDQDNAILFDDTVPESQMDEVRQYFLAMAEKVCAWLDDIGYSYCPGKIMAQNPDWCQPLSTWKRYFTTWVHTAEPQDMLEINIFFDFRCVYGERSMVEELREHIQGEWQQNPLFIYLLAENAFRYKPPIGLFGNIMTSSPKDEQQGSFDIKDAMMPVVNIARAQALRYGVGETHTLDRIQRLHERGIFKESEYSEMLLVYDFLMQLRLKYQALEAKEGLPIDNLIQLKSLTHIEQMTLKNVFNKINDFLAKLRQDFTGRSQ